MRKPPHGSNQPTNTDDEQAAKNEVIFVSFETLRRPRNVNVFIPAWKENFTAVQKQIAGHVGGKTSTQRKAMHTLSRRN